MMCLICGSQLSGRQKKYCSDVCTKEGLKRRVIGYGRKNLINPGGVGSIAELKVCIEFTEKGWDIFRAISPHAKFDLVAEKDGQLIRVEVTTGFKTIGGSLLHSKHKTKERYDVLAVYLPSSGEIVFMPNPFGDKALCTKNAGV